MTSFNLNCPFKGPLSKYSKVLKVRAPTCEFWGNKVQFTVTLLGMCVCVCACECACIHVHVWYVWCVCKEKRQTTVVIGCVKFRFILLYPGFRASLSITKIGTIVWTSECPCVILLFSQVFSSLAPLVMGQPWRSQGWPRNTVCVYSIFPFMLSDSLS